MDAVNNLKINFNDVELILFHAPYINGDTNIPIDVSSKECWDVKLGTQVAYHKDKTVENCWLKYGMATKQGSNIATRLYILDNHQPMADFIDRKIYTPNVTDWKKYCTTDYIYIDDEYFSNIIEIDPKGTYYDSQNYTYIPKSWSWSSGITINSQNNYVLRPNDIVYVQSYNDSVGIYYQQVETDGTSFSISNLPVGSLLSDDAKVVGNSIVIVNTNIVYRRTVTAIKASYPYYTKPTFGFLWQCEQYNTELWDDVREFYKNHVMRDGICLENEMFKGCNMGGALTLNIAHVATAPNFISGSNISSVFFNCIEGGYFNDCDSLFKGAESLVLVDSTTPCSVKNTISMFEDCKNLTMISKTFFDWSRRANKKEYLHGINKPNFMFNNCSSLKVIPSSGYDETDDNLIVPNSITNLFNNCSSLTDIEPVIDMCMIDPSNAITCANAFNNCNNLTNVNIKNLNFGDWRLDGTDTIHKADFSNFSEKSAKYLMENIYSARMTSIFGETPTNSFKSWNGAEEGNYVDCTYKSITFKYAYDIYAAPLSLPTDPQLAVTIPVSAFTSLDSINVVFDGISLDDVGYIYFGSSSLPYGANGLKAYFNDFQTKSFTFNLSEFIDNLPETDTVGFYLFLENYEGYLDGERTPITMTLTSPYNPNGSSVKENAELHLPATWKQYVENDNSLYQQLSIKNWKVYFGGELYDFSSVILEEE